MGARPPVPRREEARARRAAKREVLWEQDAWNDLVKSIELRQRVFPWAVGYGLQSDLWAKLEYEREVKGGIVHQEKWVEWRQRAAADMPPWRPPRRPTPTPSTRPTCGGRCSGSRRARPPTRRRGRTPRRRQAHRARHAAGPRVAAAAARRPADGGAVVARVARRRPRARLGGERPAGLRVPAPDQHVALLPHMCWSKAGRLFWLRAHGFWDRRLDDLGITPRGEAVRRRDARAALPAAAFAAVEAVVPRGRPGARARRRAGGARVPPAAGAGAQPRAARGAARAQAGDAARAVRLIRAIQPVLGVPVARSRFGVSHPSVVTTGRAGQEMCHLSPGVAPRRARPVLPLLGDALVRL